MKEKQNDVERTHSEAGFGFIESLIAIVVAGIACLALLSVAVNVMREAKKNEVRDAMNQYALQGLEEFRRFASTGPNYTTIASWCNTPTFWVYFNELAATYEETPEGSLCSNLGTSCQELDLPTGGSEEIFYRELEVEDKGTSCSVARVAVHVGILEVSGVDPDLVQPVEMIGYIAK